MRVLPQDILAKFGDEYIASERTFIMGIDRRFTHAIAERFVGRRVLETCTGGGFSTIALARHATHVVTVEVDPAIQDQARHNVDKAGLTDRVTFISGDVLEESVLDRCPAYDSAFLDPDWAVTGPSHTYLFRQSNTRPPADVLLESAFRLTKEVAIILPPLVSVQEFEGLPTHERQKLYLGESHELYCLHFGGLARSSAETELRV